MARDRDVLRERIRKLESDRRTLRALDRRVSRLVGERRRWSVLEFRASMLEQDRRWLAGLLLRDRYTDLASSDDPRSGLGRWEARVFSQNGEDGILLHLFSRIGVADRTFVEFGVGDGTECNTANLSINFGWRGLLMDRDEEAVERARRFYESVLEARASELRIVPCAVTAENIDEVLAAEGARGEIDLLSIDIDGNDYWVWRAITAVDPRVVVIEYNASFGPDRSMTVAYDPGFDRFAKHPSGYYHGASLAAQAKLGAEKGYVLVGCDSNGVNAFFVRRDVAEGRLPAVTAKDAYVPDYRRRHLGVEEQFALVKDLPFEEV
jgi:hypothetical protein